MANASELLHFLKADRDTSQITLDTQDVLAEAVQVNLISLFYMIFTQACWSLDFGKSYISKLLLMCLFRLPSLTWLAAFKRNYIKSCLACSTPTEMIWMTVSFLGFLNACNLLFTLAWFELGKIELVAFQICLLYSSCNGNQISYVLVLVKC